MEKNNRKYIWIGGIVVAIVVSIFLFSKSTSAPSVLGKFDDFAKCVSSKNVTMYGAVWCSHCAKEKAAFGDSFKYINYVECPDNIKLCIDKGVNSYPTWIDGVGIKYEGEQGLGGIAKISNCILPQ